MESKGVNKKVDQPTDWVNSLVITEKAKTGKLCVFRSQGFEQRSSGNVFNNLLLKKLHQDCLELPCLVNSMPIVDTGKYPPMKPVNSSLRFIHHLEDIVSVACPFGIKSAQEVFQKRIAQHFDNIDGVEVDIDDILVWGRNEEDHNRRLRAVLQRCKEINLPLTRTDVYSINPKFNT